MSYLSPSIGIFGYPKSGNTLANKIINSIDQCSSHGLVVNDIHVCLNQNRFISDHPKLNCTVYKSHSFAPVDGGLNPQLKDLLLLE